MICGACAQAKFQASLLIWGQVLGTHRGRLGELLSCTEATKRLFAGLL